MNDRPRPTSLAERLSVAEAENSVAEFVGALGIEQVPLASAAGRVLALAVTSDRDLPPFDRVTMDGIALRARDAGSDSLSVAGTQGAGDPPIALPNDSACIEVMTGATLPAGADCVVPVERIVRDGNNVRIEPDYEPVAGQFIHRRGSDQRQGDPLISQGQLIGAAEMAVLASVGCAQPTVSRRAQVAVISTGNELVDVESSPNPQQIRSSNDWAVAALLGGTGLADVIRARVGDDPDAIRECVLELHETCDWIVLSGGVSMGKYDYVPDVLEALGARVIFHKIRQRPGLPMWFGVSSAAKPLFALPGNPVSTLVCANRYLVPALRQGAGLAPKQPRRVRLAESLRFDPPLTWFVPVRIHADEQGQLTAAPALTNTSGDFAALVGTDGFIELPEGESEFEAGTVAPFFSWRP